MESDIYGLFKISHRNLLQLCTEQLSTIVLLRLFCGYAVFCSPLRWFFIFILLRNNRNISCFYRILFDNEIEI